MSLGYAEKLSYREDLGGQLGSPELFDPQDDLRQKTAELVEMVRRPPLLHAALRNPCHVRPLPSCLFRLAATTTARTAHCLSLLFSPLLSSFPPSPPFSPLTSLPVPSPSPSLPSLNSMRPPPHSFCPSLGHSLHPMCHVPRSSLCPPPLPPFALTCTAPLTCCPVP